MDLTVREHIRQLTERLNALSHDLIAESSMERRMSVDMQIHAVSIALSYYKNALEIEKELKEKQP